MLNNPHFYFQTIRKVVVAFGNTFNDIDIIRFTNDGTPKERFKVPLSYGNKEKYITRITSDPTLTKSVLITLPRISFNLDKLTYDPSRKQISMTRNFSMDANNALETQFVPVPYNFDFSVSIYVRNTEDGTQILEQILPFFTPDFTVTIDFMADMDQTYDMPIILNDVESTSSYEGDMMTTRYITWDLKFTAKAYIWPPIKSAKLIRSANTNIYDINTNVRLVNVNTNLNPLDALITDDYGFTEIITELPDN